MFNTYNKMMIVICVFPKTEHLILLGMIDPAKGMPLLFYSYVKQTAVVLY